MTILNDAGKESRDWTRGPASAFVWWCLPLAIGIGSGFLGLSSRAMAFAWMGALAWMGAGCVLNALRCHRLHCYISGPAFLIGAIACGLLGAGTLVLGPRALSYAVSLTFAAVLLSFLPERIWRRYA